MADKVWIVGVGMAGRASLTRQVTEIVDGADVLVGGERLLAMFPESRAELLVLGSNLSEVCGEIEARLGVRRVVVLATGDPGFFGIAKLLARRLGKDRVEIIPNLSSVQLAFARIKESWEDATFLSVHGRSLKGLVAVVRGSRKVAILTDGVNTPSAIARCLLGAGVDGYRAYLCEDLGGPEERVRCVGLESMAEGEASPLSTLLLLKEENEEPGARPGDGEGGGARVEGRWPHGIPEEEFQCRQPRRGLITKVEVRLISLAKLSPGEASVVWDIGAGSGSVAIEAALIARLGRVYAVERDAENVELIGRNLAKFGAGNVVLIHGTAPAALEGLPAPDAVFIGGSGGQLVPILDVIDRRLRAGGRVVINAATLETAGAAMASLRERGFAVEVTMVQVSRGKELAGLTHLEALDPVFVVAGRRDQEIGTKP